MAPPRPLCGSHRCTCDHAGCDLGWIETHVLNEQGAVVPASKKCPGCYPAPAVEEDRAEDRRGETYPDLRSRAVGQ